MPQNTQQDSLIFSELYFPYNRVLSPHDDTPRIVEGLNTYISQGGKLSRRPATIEINGGQELGRIDRLFLYETLNGRIYLLASIYDHVGDKWTMFYNRLSASTNWVQIGTLRSCDNSSQPQEVVVARGLAYIRSIPKAPTSDVYGTAVFDGSGTPTLRPWGVPAPSVPVAISGQIAKLASNITSTQTTVTLSSNFTTPPGLPFAIIVGYEEMLVTANSSGVLTVTRGYNDTVATEHYALDQVIYRAFAASSNRVEVSRGWEYSYAYVSTTGQISNISPPQTNPELMPSTTGPFVNSVPSIIVQGLADTTNFPNINIYRTTDGFGQAYFLETIENTGAGPITYLDNSLASGPSSATFNDPVPDDVLNTRNIGPTLTSNSVPPTTLSPNIVGIDPPITGTPLAYFAGRIWYGLRNYVFYSGNEEITEGVPEECFPTGLLANQFKFQHNVINLRSSVNALYVTTVHDTYVITGTVRDTFAVRPLYKNMGSPLDQPLSMVTWGDKVATLTNDYRIAILEGDAEPRVISDPLYTDIVDLINLGGEVELAYFGDLDKEWLVVAIHNQSDPSKSRQLVYDIKLSKKLNRDVWFTPWSIPTVVVFSGRILEDSSQRRLCFFVFNASSHYGALVRIDPTARTNTDTVISTTSNTTTQTGIDFYAKFQQHVIPGGNHVNLLRMPNLSGVVNQLTLERVLYPGDSDPKVFYYLDDLWAAPISTTILENPARRELSTGYKTSIAIVEKVCFRFTFHIQINASVRPFDLLGYIITWNPDNGA